MQWGPYCRLVLQGLHQLRLKLEIAHTQITGSKKKSFYHFQSCLGFEWNPKVRISTLQRQKKPWVELRNGNLHGRKICAANIRTQIPYLSLRPFLGQVDHFRAHKKVFKNKKKKKTLSKLLPRLMIFTPFLDVGFPSHHSFSWGKKGCHRFTLAFASVAATFGSENPGAPELTSLEPGQKSQFWVWSWGIFFSHIPIEEECGHGL